MKFLVAFLISLVLVKDAYQELSDELKERLSNYKEDCIADTKVKPEYIDRANRGDFVDDANLKCFAKCFYRKVGFVDEQGNLLVDAIKAKIPAEKREKALAIFEKCREQKGVDACDSIYLVHKCYFETSRNAESRN